MTDIVERPGRRRGEVMSEEPYMNGRGIIAHTKQLNDALFQSSTKAAIGDTFCFIAFVLLLLAFVFPSIVAAAASLPMLYLYWRFKRPWRAARRAVIEHRQRMEAETAKRGKGWAKS